MPRTDSDTLVRLDLNAPEFQRTLFNLPKPEWHSALETFKKLRQMNWAQVYRDHGLKWEKIVSTQASPGTSPFYSLRITQSCRAIAYRDGDVMRFLTIAPDHDAAYGKK
jgi:hypothetical protein